MLFELMVFMDIVMLMLMLYTQRSCSVSKVSALATIIAVNHTYNTLLADHHMRSQQFNGTLYIRMIPVLLSVCMDGQTASRPFPVAWGEGALPGDCYAVAASQHLVLCGDNQTSYSYYSGNV